jgi:hypothetical protein
MRLGVPTLTPTGATKCNCWPNGNYGGGRRFDRDCYRDEDFACGVRVADERILCRCRQHRRVARHNAVAKVLTTRLRSLPGVTAVEELPAPTAALPGARADLKVEVKARKWLIDIAIVLPRSSSTRWWRSAKCLRWRCMTRKAAASKIVRAIGIEVMHKQAYMMATLIQELRNEAQLMADFANGVLQ